MKNLTLSVLSVLAAAMIAFVSMAGLQPIQADDSDKAPTMDEKSIQQTEADMLEFCLSEDNNTPEKCHCALNSLKTELKGKDYNYLITVLTLAINDQADDVAKMIRGKSVLDLLLLAKRLDTAAKKVGNQCSGVDLNFEPGIIKI